MLKGSPIASITSWMTGHPLASAAVLIGLYWITTLLRSVDPSRPQYVPYWVPWLGSAVELGNDPDAFFAKAIKQWGPVFRVRLMGRDMVFVTSPSLISTVHRDTKTYDYVTVRKEMCETLFSVRTTILDQPFLVDTYMADTHRILLPTNIKPIISIYLQSAHDALYEMISSMDGASAHAGFGPKFPVEDSYPLLAAFDNGLPLLGSGLPRFLLSRPLKAWDALVDLLETFASEQDKCGEEATLFVQAALAGYRESDWTYRDVGIALGGQLWALQANAIYAAYWLFALLLQQPGGLSPLVIELDEARQQWQAANPSKPLGLDFFEESAVGSKTLPLLNSAIQEVLRYTASVFSLRHVTAPVKLGGHQLLTGDKVVCPVRPTHFDEDIHPHANAFDIRRYLETPHATKDGKLVPNHTMPFGGGVSMCEGRHFAMTELKLFIAIFLTYAAVEVDEGSAARPQFAWERVGLGIMHPKGDMDVIVRKRKLS